MSIDLVKLNKELDISGYFDGINKIEEDENKISSVSVIISLIFIVGSIVMHQTTFFHIIMSIFLLVMGGFALIKTVEGDKKYIKLLVTKRVNEHDTKNLFELQYLGEETRVVVKKILSQHKDGFLTYQAIYDNMEELVVAYNKNRSEKMNGIFEQQINNS